MQGSGAVAVLNCCPPFPPLAPSAEPSSSALSAQTVPHWRPSAARIWPSSSNQQPANVEAMSREELRPIFGTRDCPLAAAERGCEEAAKRRENNGSSSEPSIDQREDGLSAFATGLNFVKGMLGPGCLSIPLIFRQAGLLMGALLVFLFGTICMHKLVNCAQHLAKRERLQHLDYGDVAFEACARQSRTLRPYAEMARMAVNASIVSLQVGICSVSVVFLAAHLREIFSELFAVDGVSQQQWILLIAVPLVLINFVRSLHNIVFLSIVGSVLMFSSLAVIFQYLLRIQHKPFDELPLFTDIQGVISASGAVLYAFEGQAMVLPLENKLRRPAGMNTILSWAMASVSVIYAVCGFAGYATYGQEVEGSIALNLPRESLFTLVRLMLILVVFFGFVMQQYVIVEMIWPRMLELLQSGRAVTRVRCKLFVWEMAFRAGLVLLAVLTAYAVPNLERIIPLVGMSAGMLLAVVFPALLDTLTFVPKEFGEGRTLSWLTRCTMNAVLALIGFFALIGGVEENLAELVKRT